MSLFGKDATSFSHLDLGILCHSSLQILSSSVRLDGKRWWTAIFRSLQRCSIGFKSGLWLGHSRTVTELLWSHSFVILAVCLGSLSCWKVNLRPSLRSWALWRRFSSRISLYLPAFIFPSIATSRPIPAAEKHPHSMMLPPPCFTVGTVLDRWWAVLYVCIFGYFSNNHLKCSTSEWKIKKGTTAVNLTIKTFFNRNYKKKENFKI